MSNPHWRVDGPAPPGDTAVPELSEELGALDVLRGVGEALTETNERLDRVEAETRLARVASVGAVVALEAIRAAPAEVGRLLSAGAAARSTGADGARPSVVATPSVALRSRG